MRRERSSGAATDLRIRPFSRLMWRRTLLGNDGRLGVPIPRQYPRFRLKKQGGDMYAGKKNPRPEDAGMYH